ncbi:MAG: hypothetical protein J6K81_02190 [Rikenellaceae bacterium]|nr:hypothetical protein [Rikenellaceae bacterium]
MKRIYMFMIAALAIGATSCADAPFEMGDDTQAPVVTPAEGYELTITAGVDAGSRATFDATDLKTMKWDSDDAIGLFIHDAELEDEHKHIANNAKMSFSEENSFTGTIPANPADPNRNPWYLFAYYPYNTAAGERELYDAESWTINHASRQTQIDANHSNYDKYAFFTSTDFIEWTASEENHRDITLYDRTAALRFLIKTATEGENVITEGQFPGFTEENLEEVDIFIVNNTLLETKALKDLSESDGVVPLSGHFKFNHTQEECGFTPVTGEVRNYVEVDFLGSSRTESPLEIKIDADNSTYVWAVVPPFTLGADQTLVAVFNTASYKVVYTYTKDGGHNFEANKLYNFKNVVATTDNVVSNVPVVHTQGYVLGESTSTTVTTNNGAQTTYRYPISVDLYMEVDLPIRNELAGHELKYYIRYGYCDYCGADGTENHNGLDVPYSDTVENTVSWTTELNEIKKTSYSIDYEATAVLDNNSTNVNKGKYRVRYTKKLSDTEFLKEAFNGTHDPVYQAYVVCQNAEHKEIYYGHVVHVDMNPYISDFDESSFADNNNGKTPLTLSGNQFYINVPDAYIFNGTAPAPYYWVNTISSLRVYRCDVSESVNQDGSLKTATLEDAVAANSDKVEQLSSLQTINSIQGFTGFYIDINTNGNGYVRYRENGGDKYDLATNSFDDYNGAYRYVMQAYDKTTMELVWIRSEYFRLCDAKANNNQ